MTSQNNESMNVDSLSAIFKKPKPVVKPYQRKQNALSLSSSINVPSTSRTVFAARAANDQNTPQILHNSVNFSGHFDSMDESVPTVKKRRASKPKKSLKISFSRSTNASAEDSVAESKPGYLRQLRKNAKPAKEANFSADVSIAGSRGANGSASKSVENLSTPVFSFSSLPSWNSSVEEPRRRRCSTPLKGTSRSKTLDTNLSLIPRALPFDNELSSPSILSAHGFHDGSLQSSSSTSTASFVTKMVQASQSVDSDKENVPVAVEKATRGRKVDPSFKLKSVFPKLAPYCNKSFYEYLISKMEPKYGIETKRRVVKVSQKVHDLVQNIVSKKNNYHQLVHRLKTFLCRWNIIRTSYEFYWFSLKFLPREAVTKIVPIIQPFGSPLLADFDPQSVFEPIRTING